MKDISIYFQNVSLENQLEDEMLGNHIQVHKEDDFPKIEKNSIVIFDVPEYRNSKTESENKFTNNFRQDLYRLYEGTNWEKKIYDLGTILPGDNIADTNFAVKSVCVELIKNDIIPIVIGGTQDLTLSIYDAYKELEQLINLTTIDNQFDIGKINDKILPNNWLGQILFNDLNYLFNYSNIGAQGHYISKSQFELFNELFFDVCRLGDIHENISVAEPFLRNTDILSVDLTAVRSQELQNDKYSSPNGLFADEICRLMRYAGISDKLTSLGIFNYYSTDDKTTDELIAQMIWYFIEGYFNRKGDFPIGNIKHYTKFRVFLEEMNEEILFLKSNKSDRWWIEVQYLSGTNKKYIRHQMVPCSYDTYLETMNGNIPDLWWKTYQKMV